jgi:YEATS domain-containing protein 4
VSVSRDAQGVVLTKPVVYGNIARYFGKKREDDGHTHSWTCYLRPFKNEDMSVYVKKVQFKLHDSYPSPIRVVMKPPYEINETGWGEFEVIIKIFFADSAEKPITIYHLIKLFQTDPAIMAGKKNLVSENYDELVFTDPTNTMYHLLTSPKQMVPAIRHEPGIDYKEREQRSIGALNNAHRKLKNEISDLSDRLKMSRESIQRLKEQVEQAEEEELVGT